MAKENFIITNGWILDDPNIYISEKDPEKQRVMFNFMTIRCNREDGNYIDKIFVDIPLVMSGNPKLVEQARNFKKGDIVEVKGTVATKQIQKRSFCKKCQTPHIEKGMIAYVNPIYMEQKENIQDKEAAIAALKKRKEISNNLFIIGSVVSPEIKTYQPPKGPLIASYQIAINRKYRLKDEPPEIKSDFPWIKAYGENAIRDKKCLSQGSLIMIDGYIQVRDIIRTAKCENPECNEVYEWTDSTAEIVAYATEYLQNYKTPEQLEQEEEENIAAAKKSIFGE